MGASCITQRTRERERERESLWLNASDFNCFEFSFLFLWLSKHTHIHCLCLLFSVSVFLFRLSAPVSPIGLLFTEQALLRLIFMRYSIALQDNSLSSSCAPARIAFFTFPS